METGKRSGFRGVWPVVRRELREGARWPFNHWLRVGSAVGGMVLFYLIASEPQQTESEIGIRLFTSIHALLLLLICCLVPAMTADCIALEKRDGTLGLLFLTPLTAGGIVAGKGATQSFRTFTLWLAVLPILIVPILTGGVGWIDVLSAVTIEFCATVLCLAAGLLASSLVKSSAAAFVLAMVLGVFLVAVFGKLTVENLPASLFGGVQLNLSMITGIWFEDSGGFFPSIQVETWGDYLNQRGMWTVWVSVLMKGATAALLIFCVVVKFAARRIESSWQDNPPSLRREKLERQYCSPIFQRWFARRTQRAMDWSPIAWLQQYSWKARVFKWGLCLACVISECAASMLYENSGYGGGWLAWQQLSLVALAVVFTFVGVNGFVRDKETGALELILVTPLTANQIIFGRAWGLWKQFLPAILICFGVYLFIGTRMGYWENEAGSIFGMVVGGFLSLPFFVTYFALSVRNVIVAVILIWMVLFLAVGIGAILFNRLDAYPYSFWTSFNCVIGSNALFALPAWFRLRHNLSRRIYSF